MKITSQLISWLFIPLITPVLAVVLVMFTPSYQDVLNEDCLYTMSIEYKWKILYYYFFFCMLVPGLAILYLKGIGVISTIEIDNRRERVLPILIMFFSCLGLYLLHALLVPKGFNISKYIFSYPLAGVIATAVFFFLTFWKKVSLHAGGMGILSGFLIAYAVEMQEFQMWIILFAIIISGMVMSARVYLEKHTLLEVVIGWFTGTFVTFAVNYYY